MSTHRVNVSMYNNNSVSMYGLYQCKLSYRKFILLFDHGWELEVKINILSIIIITFYF